MDSAEMGTDPSLITPSDESKDLRSCQLLGPTALVVQAIMGTLVILSLVVKRQLERRKRPWRIWIWDVGKQLAGQAVIHLLNLVISDSVAAAVNNNPCSLYFLNVLIDTTIGVAIFYFALKVSTWYCVVYKGYEGFVSGEYGDPPQPKLWWKQLVPYLVSIVFMKLVVLVPLTLPRISTSLISFGHALLQYLSPSIQVIFVMAVFPLIMNVVQFCVVDQLIKANGQPVESGGRRVDLGEDEEAGYSLLPRHSRQQGDDGERGKDDGESSSVYNSAIASSSTGMIRRNSSSGVLGGAGGAASVGAGGIGTGAGGSARQSIDHGGQTLRGVMAGRRYLEAEDDTREE